MSKNSNLFWVDLEMTGLEPETHRILEIATIVTDKDLNILAEGPVIAIHQADSVLKAMDEWCTKTHGESGLLGRVRKSSIHEGQAEALTLEFLKKLVKPGSSPMCGNSIGQDRRFLHQYMGRMEAFFHYRNLDVSTVKELARRWRPDILEKVQKSDTHLALQDIKESIAELKVYRDHFFKTSE